ncbi:uncharacterized protein EDB91DRAFT_1236355 [Suillus paluster]|uniref:uncharacterized protein n=1 Tax=Suillus paluster TaxID=48578 RepID=UPI001B86CB88|nr:uncharacterized protein EDB91DRAFT_1236355 [Suillus paluster]KAG1745470.1 hypothetical protein EDB91DRAFT_1236355 [Suillus paluster]
MPICDGCSSTFTESGYSRHLAHTRNPACVSIYDDMYNYMPSHSQEIFEDFDSDHLPGNSSLQLPEDKDPEDQLKWNVDEDEDDLEEVDNDGWVAEQEADWEPPIQGAEEPAGINDENIPMDKEDTVVDLDQHMHTRHYEAELPLHQGPYITKFPIQSARAIIDDEFMQAKHGYQSYCDKLHGNNWAPFTSHINYEVARWAKLRGQGSTAFSDLLDIEGVYEKLDLSYRNSRELNKIIDTKIPAHCPRFQRQEILMAGEAFDVYFWDIIECVKALFGDPELTPYLVFAPERHYSDEDKTQCLYHEMHTGQWWWHTQKQLEKEKPGATIIPVLLSSDKTQATYPIYMTIENLPKEIWQQPSHNAQILVGYLPTTKLEHITNKAASGDGTVRRGHPLVACYIGDYPEQLLVTGMKTGEYSKCDIPSTELGSKDLPFELRNLDEILDALALADEDPTQFVKACRDAVRGILDFLYLAQYPCHSDLMLMLLSKALN